MTASSDEQLGTLEYMMIELPDRGAFPAEATRELLALAAAEIIRVLDVVVIDKGDGQFAELEVTELDDPRGLRRFAGTLIDILTIDDISRFADLVPPRTRSAVIVIENRWASALTTALASGGATCVATGPLDPGSVVRACDAQVDRIGIGPRRRSRPAAVDAPIVRRSLDSIPATLVDRLLSRSVARSRSRRN